MPRRDPNTGQFVSGGGSVDFSDIEVVRGEFSLMIPAADLAGGVTTAQVFGDESEIIDFSPVLAGDDEFEVFAMQWASFFSGPTTATAETAGMAEYQLTRDWGTAAAQRGTPAHFGGSTNAQEGIIDISSGQTVGEPLLMSDVLYFEASNRDTTTGTAAGSDAGRRFERISYLSEFGSGPVFDRDDELFLPAELHVDGADDHAIVFQAVVQLEGAIIDR